MSSGERLSTLKRIMTCLVYVCEAGRHIALWTFQGRKPWFHRAQPLWVSLVLNQMFVYGSGQAQALKTNSVLWHYESVRTLVPASDAKAIMSRESGAHSRHAFTMRPFTAIMKNGQIWEIVSCSRLLGHKRVIKANKSPTAAPLANRIIYFLAQAGSVYVIQYAMGFLFES